MLAPSITLSILMNNQSRTNKLNKSTEITENISFHQRVELINSAIASSCQSGKAQLNTLLGHAYKAIKNEIQNTIQEQRSECECEKQKSRLDALFLATNDLHRWKPKHTALLDAYPEHAAKLNKLVELRQATKDSGSIEIARGAALSVDPVGKRDIRAETIQQKIIDEMLCRKAQLSERIELTKLVRKSPLYYSRSLIRM